ncbi:MAG TPA: hypothetical protein VMY05_01330 [Acidobacteriota bacterium]|nr:hypothetical protein [Acidobacteriota bacterium]
MRSPCLKIAVLLVGLHVPAGAADPILALADSLMSRESYDAAITEYTRHAFFNPHYPSLDESYARIGLCYAYLDDHDRAIAAMDTAVFLAATDSLLDQRRLDRAVVHVMFRDYPAAGRDMEQVLRFSRYEDATGRAMMLRLVTAILRHDWATALSACRSLPESNIGMPAAIESTLVRASPGGYKSPATAMLFSTLLPGAGQIYCGAWGDGLNAALLNGALGYLTGYYAVNERYVSAFSAFLFLFRRYYNGNRVNAYNLAIERNAAVDERIEKELLRFISQAYGLPRATPE